MKNSRGSEVDALNAEIEQLYGYIQELESANTHLDTENLKLRQQLSRRQEQCVHLKEIATDLLLAISH